MIGREFDAGIEAKGYAAGIIDGARLRGARIESADDAVKIVMDAIDAADTRQEAVGS